MCSRKQNRDLKQPRPRAKWTLPEVFSQSRQLLRVSDVVHMVFRTWHLLICSPQVNASIQSNLWHFCAFFTLFNKNVWKKEPFLYFLLKSYAVGAKKSKRFLVNREPWFSMASAGKNLWVKVKCLRSPWMLLNCNLFPEELFNWERKRRWYSGPFHERDRLKIPRKISRSIFIHTVFFLFMCFEMYMSASRKQDFHYILYILFPVNLINMKRVVYP